MVEGKITGSTGNAVFVLKDENSNVWNNKVIDLGKINPGDSGDFTITMDASGSSVDMYATLEIEKTNLPTNLKFYTTSDHKSELHKYYSFLEKSGTTSETLKIYWYWNPYLDDEEDNKFINVSNLEANVKVSTVQISEYAMMKNGANYMPSTYAYNGTEFWNDDYRKYIRTITFGNDLSNLPSTCNDANLCFDISENNSVKKVYAYLIDSGITVEEWDDMSNQNINKPLYNLYIVSEAPIFAPTNCDFIFSNFNNLEGIDFNNNFNTSKVESMAAMFAPIHIKIDRPKNNNTSSRIMLLSNAYTNDEIYLDNRDGEMDNKIKKLDLSKFNTSNVANMYGMLYYCSLLTDLDLSNFNTSKVADMGSMFSWCELLTSLDLSSFNTQNVTNMRYMYNDCVSLVNLNINSFNTENVVDMEYMFTNCSSLTTTINIMNANVIGCYNMFNGAATSPNAKIIVNYIAEASTLVDNMIEKRENSNIVKGIEL